jgi:hypothetical protein
VGGIKVPSRDAGGNRVFEQTLCSHLLPHNGEADPHSSRETRHRKVQ